MFGHILSDATLSPHYKLCGQVQHVCRTGQIYSWGFYWAIPENGFPPLEGYILNCKILEFIKLFPDKA